MASGITITTILKVLFLCEISMTDCAKILYLPFPLYSHIQTVTWLRDDLKDFGHDLWIAYPDVLAPRGILNDPSFNFIKYDSLGDVDPDKYYIKPAVDFYLDPDNFRSITTGIFHLVNRALRYVDPTHPPIDMFKSANVMNELVLRDAKLLDTIKSHNFDLLLVDGTVGMPYAIIAYKLDIPFCFIGPFYDSWRTGAPTYPSFSPIIGLGASDTMGFKDRVVSTLQHILLMVANPLMAESMVSLYASEKPYISLTNLVSKAELWLVEQDTVLDFPRSAMPNTKFVGGLSVHNSKPLQGRFKTFYENATTGVVVVSFGGSVKALPKQFEDKLVRAFTLTKYSFVWRSNITSSIGKNLLVSDWIPQNDLLGQSKTKLFITHCGAYSQYESIYHGVPMIGMPVYAEQHYNSRRMAWKKYGLAMDFHKNSAEELAQAIITVIDSPIYKENVVKASMIFRDKTLTPRQEAAYWIDHVIKYGGSYFRSAGLDLTWYQFMCVDVLSFIVAMMMVFLYSSYKSVIYIANFFFKVCKHKTKVE
ncbi:UDP-glucuronosyltransferase 1A8-like [Haliotis rufescens]|uniref:UDP-glucuronosyltransferase 1A8-like n=1 Tax=Haliotis rufescens TaxID=6454 RepID=UPI001EAFF602|nr:UDP-glucuronosyltransferase 1A8-like [Haliotis rufescens]XP_046379134.1 UDP-glucuronosyltransferase 1A8-like [Haliotis rufescens]XP_046379138.1 UDP-glucuronosyltransferase 1A8-like [Haliotis rufescens]XP_046379146.1 UDP-glucuronosyltransferase 1A8-like [Haliotis rufescens]